MSYEDDEEQDALAAEYVLGTLDANERAQAHALIGLDPGFAALVRTWERRLGELNVMVEPAEPPPEIWARIKARVAGGPAAAPVQSAQAPLAPAAPMPPPASAAPAPPPTPVPPLAAAPSPPAAPASPAEPPSPFGSPAQFEPSAFFRTAPIVNIGPAATAQPAAPPPPVPPASQEPTIDFGPLPKFEPVMPPAATLPLPEPAAKPAAEHAAPAGPGKPADTGEHIEFPGLAELVAERQKTIQSVPEQPAEPSADILKFRRRARRWRAYAGFSTAIAACLAGYLAVWVYQPDRLPPNLRLPQMVKVQVVEKEIHIPPPPAPPAPPMPARFVAVLQREPSAPAFLLTVDTQNRTLTVRRVSADKEPGRSYELWLVSNRLPGPRSLGVVGSDEFTRRPLAETFAPEVVNTATYAVSLEPEGGSPTGSPTGPVLFTGRLVESLPAQPGTTP
jgi:anti-sigma-K factor RskA